MTLEDIIRVDTDTRSYCRLHTAAA
jgi:hypothetical protein